MKKSYDAVESVSSRAIGGMTITKVIREHLPLKTDPHGSFKTIQDIAFHFDTEDHESNKILLRMYGLIPQFED